MSYSGTKTLYDMIYLNPEQPFTYEWHYSLEKAVAPYSSPLAWKIPWSEEPGRLQSMGSQRVGYDWATSLSLFTFKHWKRKWQPTPVFLPGESQGWGSLVGCHLWGRTESDMTEAISSISGGIILILQRGSWDPKMVRQRGRSRTSSQMGLWEYAYHRLHCLTRYASLSSCPFPKTPIFADMQFPACPYMLGPKDKPLKKKSASNPLQNSDGMMKKCVSHNNHFGKQFSFEICWINTTAL